MSPQNSSWQIVGDVLCQVPAADRYCLWCVRFCSRQACLWCVRFLQLIGVCLWCVVSRSCSWQVCVCNVSGSCSWQVCVCDVLCQVPVADRCVCNVLCQVPAADRRGAIRPQRAGQAGWAVRQWGGQVTGLPVLLWCECSILCGFSCPWLVLLCLWWRQLTSTSWKIWLSFGGGRIPPPLPLKTTTKNSIFYAKDFPFDWSRLRVTAVATLAGRNPVLWWYWGRMTAVILRLLMEGVLTVVGLLVFHF